MLTLDEKLASQIGDDVQRIYDHEALFIECRAELARLTALVADLIAANAAVMVRDAKAREIMSIASRSMALNHGQMAVWLGEAK